MSRNTKIMLISGLIIFTLFLFITSVPKVGLQTTPNNNDRYPENNQTPQGQRYPYQELYHKYSERTKDYRFLLVEDLDKSSKVDTYLWKSRLQHGYLTRSVNGKYSFELAEEVLNLFQNIVIIKQHFSINILIIYWIGFKLLITNYELRGRSKQLFQKVGDHWSYQIFVISMANSILSMIELDLVFNFFLPRQQPNNEIKSFQYIIKLW